MTRLGLQSRPRLASYVHLRFDLVRQRHVLLSPERVGLPDDMAVEVLSCCDGARTVADIAAELGRRYQEDPAVVARDLIELLQPMADARHLVEGEGRAIEGLPAARAAETLLPIEASPDVPAPVGLLAELTHRCPLQCVYCSNPLELESRSSELPTEHWQNVLKQAVALGVLQVHLSGGEPTLRRDLPAIIGTAAELGLYTNLITAGVNLNADKLAAYQDAGLLHVQLSVQAADEGTSRAISGFPNALAAKRRAAEAARACGMALTINAPVHALNLDGLEALIDFAAEVDAQRIEIAHVQYYGWANANQARLLPTREQVQQSVAVVDRARRELRGRLAIDFVAPDQHAKFPKPCMGGWGRNFINVTPSGTVLPCHAAQTIGGLAFENVRDRTLAWIWRDSAGFNAYRGTGWMSEPCASCARREKDWGGCRCQAFAMLGDAAATDPACHLSPHHGAFRRQVDVVSAGGTTPLIYRRVQDRQGETSA